MAPFRPHHEARRAPEQQAGRQRPRPVKGISLSRPGKDPDPRDVLQLQRFAGNAAVISLLQRQPATPAATAPISSAALWPNGPKTGRKTVAHTLDEYVGWIKEVEAAYPGRENVVQRVRRLYYSDYVSSALVAHGQKPGAGKKFDEIIDTSDAGDPPLQSPPISQAALDGLFETDNIVTPTKSIVDVSHIWPDLDLAIAGKTAKAEVGKLALGGDFQGLLTWSGDLASWFVEFVDRIRKKTGRLRIPDVSSWGDLDKSVGTDSHRLFASLVTSKVSKDDLLGDFDAQAIVDKNVKPGRVFGGTPTTNVSDMLLDYYKPATGAAPEASRFATFVRAAQPEIPYGFDPTNPNGFIRLGSRAKGSIFIAVTDAAKILLYDNNVTPVDDLDFVIMEIAARFRDFLSEGLAKGDAPWP